MGYPAPVGVQRTTRAAGDDTTDRAQLHGSRRLSAVPHLTLVTLDCTLLNIAMSVNRRGAEVYSPQVLRLRARPLRAAGGQDVAKRPAHVHRLDERVERGQPLGTQSAVRTYLSATSQASAQRIPSFLLTSRRYCGVAPVGAAKTSAPRTHSFALNVPSEA